MISITTPNYSDIYPGAVPTVEELLNGINSKIVVVMMAVVNAELHWSGDKVEVQMRLTTVLTQNFPADDMAQLKRGIGAFTQKVGGAPAFIWAKRYARELMKYAFLHYQGGEETSSTPEEEVQIWKAYLVTVERMNMRDRDELAKVKQSLEADDPFFFQKLVWPFTLNQFDANNRVNPAWEFVRLLSFIAYTMHDDQLLLSWKRFIEMNGFENLNAYLGSVFKLMDITQQRYPDKEYKVFALINAEDIPAHLLNLSFDVAEYDADKDKQVEYLGIKAKPLFNTAEMEFVILDLDFLNNKIYNGFLFDIYYQTQMEANTRFKIFPDFKTTVGSLVSERIIFSNIIKALFTKKHVRVHFDEEGRDGYPDAYIRINNKIFLFECKDNLVPGCLLESYSFKDIKAHIDGKFIKSEKGRKKGITQVLAQLEQVFAGGFDYDPLIDTAKLIVYPIIVHTNFTYRMPGINSYLNNEFLKGLKGVTLPAKAKVADLTVIDLETFFYCLYFHEMGIQKLEKFIGRYHAIIKDRQKRLLKTGAQDDFLRAGSSFEEIFHSLIELHEVRRPKEGILKYMMDIFKIDDAVTHAF